ncbi:hypothetical protein [Clostridium sp.]|uniref:hypothetical protein n=1 Tax=Clostridium sp. TaxID=1506 RepID=UPI002FC5FFE8
MKRNRMLWGLLLLTFFIVGCRNNIKEKVTQLDKTINEPKVNSGNQTNEKNEEYSIKPNLIYYVLVDEYLESNDVKNPNTSQLIRHFMCYNGVESSIYPYTSTVVSEKVNNIDELRKTLLLDNPEELKLPPNTIVSTDVLNKWKSQNYDDSSSYSDESPKGLTYDEIQ